MEENKRISDLFERARNEAPKTSFDDMKSNFLTVGAVGGVGIIAKWAAASFKLKAIIMITLFSTLTISGIMIAAQLTPTTEVVEVKADKNLESEIEYIEISNLDGIKKTVIFDENDQVLEVMIDSTKKVNPKVTTTTTKIELTAEEPELLQKMVLAPGNQLIELKKNAPIVLISTDSLVMKKFKITDKTTSEDLEKIAKQARAAGIIFDYSARIRGNSIKKVQLDMKIDQPDDSSDWSTSISGKTFTYVFGWWEEKNGTAVRFITNKETMASCQ